MSGLRRQFAREITFAALDALQKGEAREHLVAVVVDPGRAVIRLIMEGGPHAQALAEGGEVPTISRLSVRPDGSLDHQHLLVRWMPPPSDDEAGRRGD